MPDFKTHIGFGLVVAHVAAASVFVCDLFPPEPKWIPLLIGLVMIGAIIPDMDTQSKGRNILYAAMALVDMALIWHGWYKWAAILGFFSMLPAVGSHRGWTHTWWAMILVPLLPAMVACHYFKADWRQVAPFYMAVVLGYFSHLLLDRKFF